MRYGKYMILAALALMLLFPEEIFPALVGIFIILSVVLLVVELVLDVYIVVKIMIPGDKKRNDKEDTE